MTSTCNYLHMLGINRVFTDDPPQLYTLIGLFIDTQKWCDQIHNL